MIKKDDNILIDYRNLLLISRGIIPNIYCVVKGAFLRTYDLYINPNDNTIYLKFKSNNRPINEKLFKKYFRNLSFIYNIKESKLRTTYFKQICEDFKFNYFLQEYKMSNDNKWLLATLPD